MPSAEQVEAGLAPQLTLEAALWRQGAFEGLAGARDAADLRYIKLSGGDPPATDAGSLVREGDGDGAASIWRASRAHARYASADLAIFPRHVMEKEDDVSRLRSSRRAGANGRWRGMTNDRPPRTSQRRAAPRVRSLAHRSGSSANAGSGKTHVLVDRVIRLMLAGTRARPHPVPHLTKAAAAEMANRVFERLGAWVVARRCELDQASRGARASARPSATMLKRARQLFTLALETPGGLKIQTIHAFCERLLQLFPVEAGVVPGFEVMDERERRRASASRRAGW